MSAQPIPAFVRLLLCSTVGTIYAPQIRVLSETSRSNSLSSPARRIHPAQTPNGPKTPARRENVFTERWRTEIEDRDNAVLVTLEVTRNALAPAFRFRSSQGVLDALDVKKRGDKFTFRLPDNPISGAREGEMAFRGSTLTGSLKGTESTLRFHGRPERASDGRKAKVVYLFNPSGAFAGLKLKVEGKSCPLEERMRFHRVPGVQIARIENFRVVESAGIGVANSETGEPVTPRTLFHAGGMGSPLVNLLAVKLAAEGRLDLRAEVNQVLKHPLIPDNAFSRFRKVTVLDLVNAASGLTQYKFAGYRPGVRVPTLSDLLYKGDPAELDPLEVKAVPGTTNGAGVNGALLELVIQEVTGKPLPQLMQTYVFTPFGMTLSTYEPLPRPSAQRNVSHGHYETGEVMLDALHFYPAAGETGLWTTAGDFAKCLCEIQKLAAGKPNLILPKGREDLKKLVLTPKWLLGLIVGDNDYAYHGGDPYGFFANHSTHLREGHGVVVMENRMMGWELNNEIVRAVISLGPETRH